MENKKSKDNDDKKSSAVVVGGPKEGNNKSTTALAAANAPSAAARNANALQPPLFHAVKLEALQADVSILQALLRRNRCNHGRTKYHQRLSMALSAIQRCQALDLYANFKTLKREILATAKRKEVQRQRQLIFWEIQTRTANKDNNRNDDDQEEMQRQRQSMLALQETLLALPSILERLEFAAAALWVEMARGFFLPFSVTAVAAVARVKWLLRQAGLWILLPTQLAATAAAAAAAAGESYCSTTILEDQQDEWTILERAWQSAHFEPTTSADFETTILWPQSQRNELRDILLASKTPPSQADTAAAASPISLPTTARTMVAGKNVKSVRTSATSDCMGEASTSVNNDSDYHEQGKEEEMIKGASVGLDDDDDDHVVDHDDDDTGVVVGGLAFMTRAATGEELMEPAVRGGEDDDVDDSGINTHHQHAEFDRNMDRVQEFKRNRSTKKKKKKQEGGVGNDDNNNMALQKKQRKRTAAAAVAAAAAACSDSEYIVNHKTSKTKKQKNNESSQQKKKKKGDFFDELFG